MGCLRKGRGHGRRVAPLEGTVRLGVSGDAGKRVVDVFIDLATAGWARPDLAAIAEIGVAAPALLVAMRLLQGLALGGEYGGAAIYVAEHAPNNKRGLYTSWIQTTATLGLFLSLIVIMSARALMPAEDFAAWGWRAPFLLSAVLLAVAATGKSRATGSLSTLPLGDSAWWCTRNSIASAMPAKPSIVLRIISSALICTGTDTRVGTPLRVKLMVC